MGEKEHFWAVFVRNVAWGLATQERVKYHCRAWVRKYNFHGNKILLTCRIKDPPFQGMLYI